MILKSNKANGHSKYLIIAQIYKILLREYTVYNKWDELFNSGTKILLTMKALCRNKCHIKSLLYTFKYVCLILRPSGKETRENVGYAATPTMHK